MIPDEIVDVLYYAPRAVLHRIVRAAPHEWTVMLVDGAARSFVGHFEDWRTRDDGFGIECGDALLTDRARSDLGQKFMAYADEIGLPNAVFAIQETAKSLLGRHPI